ncbi:MAG: PPOX class F420-dependent oxidoreductase [Chloroflexota bacterium]
MTDAVAPTQTTTENTFDILKGHQYLNLTTYRKDGSDVTRPVWFARDGGMLYLMTVDPSGKVTHIRNDDRVIVGPCDARGNPLSDETALGIAQIFPKGYPTAIRANDVMNRKYGLIKRAFGLAMFFRKPEAVWIEIKPRTA